jgi:AcrR family transcriptional regulator
MEIGTNDGQGQLWSGEERAERGERGRWVGYPRPVAGQETDAVVVPTGRHGLPANVVAEHQRERILAATIAVVAKRGYRSTSIDHIVKAARVGYVAFYELFAGKEECFAAAFERIVADTRAELSAAVPSSAGWTEQICTGLAALVELIAAEPARARFALVEAQAAGADAYRRYEAAIDTAIPMLREGRALRPADAAALSETLEEATIGGIAWMFHQLVAAAEAEKVPDLLGEAIAIALAPYLGEREARRRARSATAKAH